MFNFLKPKEDVFFQLFDRSAKAAVDAVLLLREILQAGVVTPETEKKMSVIEAEADEASQEIIDRLNQTFITPLDREDIYALANMFEDLVDMNQELVELMIAYKLQEPFKGAIALSRLLADCVQELARATGWLINIRSNNQKILDNTAKVVTLEEEGDKLYYHELARLFTKCPDPIEIIKLREVLVKIEMMITHCEKIADLLRGVVMKYA
ncbi:MAG: DUF47 family protein [Negativicutes bacterium]|nr:DUF47 family protein [Negativicutes bacterium]